MLKGRRKIKYNNNNNNNVLKKRIEILRMK